LTTTNILLSILAAILVLIALAILFIAVHIRKISLHIERTMHTLITVQLQHSEYTEQVTDLVNYIYGKPFPPKIIPPNQREAGQ
jgi:predicted Holliday junction resolvase-like endonuclease